MNNVYMGLDAEDFIFEEGTTFEENYGISNEELNEYGVIECVDEPEVACYRIALENEQNFNAIMSSIMMKEMSVLEATGETMVYEAVDFRAIADKVKEAVKKFWAKVKGVFKKLMDNLNTIVMSNKAFVKKYRSAGKLKMPKDVSITGYDFSHGHLVIDYSKYSNKVSELVTDGAATLGRAAALDDDKAANMKVLSDLKDGFLDQIRGAVIGRGPVKAANFSREMHKFIFGSENTIKIKVADVAGSFGEILSRLETAKLDKKDAQASYKEAEKSIKEFLKIIKEEIEDAGSDDDSDKAVRLVSSIINSSLPILSSTLSIQTKALQARALQDRKVANVVIRANTRKGKTTSDTISGYEESYNMDLEDVVLV